MNFITYLLALSFLIIILIKAFQFQKATSCRQIAWLKSTEVVTEGLLSRSSKIRIENSKRCQLLVKKVGLNVVWTSFPSLRQNRFNLYLEGKL